VRRNPARIGKKNLTSSARSPWERLQNLRHAFVDSAESLGLDYWSDEEILRLYDESLGRRIAWKWSAVLEELGSRKLLAPLMENVSAILDWGCGTGVASEVFLSQPYPSLRRLELFDRSGRAAEFAKKKIESIGISAEIAVLSKKDFVGRDAGVLISHVLNEISPAIQQNLLHQIAPARFVLWVEPGAFAQSRRLSEIRDILVRQGFHAWAPCFHSQKCPILKEGHEKDWCHFFAEAPGEVHHSSFWSDFSQTLGVDLRSNPYSFLLMAKDLPPPSDNAGRILQRPRVLKAHSELAVCQPNGALEKIRVEKRTDPELFKQMKKDSPRFYALRQPE
jgi:ribosomal protein RSM22 (predicted rRNA methylase)